MKKTIRSVRRFDNLGRVVIPSDMRKRLGIHKNDRIEIHMEDNSIILRRHNSLATLEDTFSATLRAYCKYFGGQYLVCDEGNVLYMSESDATEFPALSEDVKDYIGDLRRYRYNPLSPLDVFGGDQHPVGILQPIEADGSPAGAIIQLFQQDATKEQETNIKILAEVLGALCEK